MRPITGADVIAFYDSRMDLLVLAADGEFAHIDGEGSAYSYIATDNDTEVQVLLERSTITNGNWFPDALDNDGALSPSVADEMAHIINQDGILAGRAWKATAAGLKWEEAARTADQLAIERAAAVAELVAYCGGNQSEASRILGLNQSTVNKLVKKHEGR